MYKPNFDRLNQKLKSLKTGKYFKLDEGDNKIRLLPPVKAEGEFYLESTLHYGFNDGQRDRAFPCLEAMKGKSCPVCALYRKATEEGEKDLAQKIRPVTNYLSNVVDRTDNTIKIWGYNGKMLKSIINYLMDEEYGPEILDAETGRDFTINKTGTGFKTRYGEPRISPKSKPIGVEDWESKLHALDGELEFQSYESLVKMLEDAYGDFIEEWGIKFSKDKAKAVTKKVEEEDGDDEEAEEELPKSTGRGPAKAADKGKKGKAHVEEDDEVDSEDDSEEDLDEQPVAKKKAKKIEEEEDDDDIEEFLSGDDDEELIEDEEPVAKKKAKKK